MQLREINNQFATESSHWYDREGNPRYTIIGKNGRERPTTLRDARELGYYPSVSTILQLEAKPALTNWLINQALMSALTLPRDPGESLTEFMARASRDSKEQAKKAAERGTYLHGLLEECVREGRLTNRAAPDADYIEPVLIWLNVKFVGYTWSVERSFACVDGYGGKIDLHGYHPTLEPVVIDYKSKDFDDPDKKLAYDEHVTQLAAYGHGLGLGRFRAVNLFVSSTVPGLIVPIEWAWPEIVRGYVAFRSLLSLWKARKLK